MSIIDPTQVGTAVAAFLFVAIVVMLELGRRLGLKGKAEGESSGAGALAGAVYGLLALLIAFTFSGATSRFDSRRHLVVEEANAIGTAYLRVDMVPPTAQPALRDGFRRYLDSPPRAPSSTDPSRSRARSGLRRWRHAGCPTAIPP
jgi:hypothetical protein